MSFSAISWIRLANEGVSSPPFAGQLSHEAKVTVLMLEECEVYGCETQGLLFERS